MYSPLPPLHFFLLFFWGHSTATQFLPTRWSSPGATRSTRTSRRSSPSRCPCGARLPWVLCICILRFRCIRHVVINVINNIRTHFIISFYVICAMIYCSFCCIYVWLDPGTYMTARFMFFYKPGVTRLIRREDFSSDRWRVTLLVGCIPSHLRLSSGPFDPCT